MSHSPFISVIMPVYNAERYLSIAVECVLNQTFKDLELVLVNDCSTDSSSSICKKYADLDERVKVIHLEQNGGAGNARNKGIDQANGDYITFVDSDDEIELDLYEKVFYVLEEMPYDVVVWGMVEEFFDKQGKIVSRNKVISPKQKCSSKKEVEEAVIHLEKQTLLGYQCNKVYKRSLLNEYKIRFGKMILYEDYFFNLDIMKHTESMYVINEALYYYKKRFNDSVTTRFVSEYFKLSYHRVKTMYQACQEWGINEKTISSILGQIYLRYILSALMRNCDDKSNMSKAKQRAWIKKVTEERLYQELVKDALIRSHSLKILQKLLNARLYGLCIVLGDGIFKFKKLLPVAFAIIKRSK